jgi:hypothetical protein
MSPHHYPSSGSKPPSFWRSRYAFGLIALGAIALFFLVTEHRAHFFGALPYVLLVASLLLHIFMHAGHGGGHAHGGHDEASRPAQPRHGERS